MQTFNGTIVSGLIYTKNKFSIEKALEFNGTKHTPLNIIDLEYEMKEENCLLIVMQKESIGSGTRAAGRQMRTKTLNLINSKHTYPVSIDWAGIPVISSSFADEFIGKLFVELGPMQFGALVRNKNMELLVHQLLDKAISQRVKQGISN